MSLLQIIVAVAIITFCGSIAIYTILDRILKYKENKFNFDEQCQTKLDRLENYVQRVDMRLAKLEKEKIEKTE